MGQYLCCIPSFNPFLCLELNKRFVVVVVYVVGGWWGGGGVVVGWWGGVDGGVLTYFSV